MTSEPVPGPAECGASKPTFLGFDAYCTVPPGAHRTVTGPHGPLDVHECADFAWTAEDIRARVKQHADIRP
jgi:hypothetical protein